MYKKSFFAVLLLLMVATLIVPIFPVSAWNYTDEVKPDDTNFEEFGPRADQLLIKLYETAEDEWDALDRGKLDMTDTPLTKPYYDKFTTPPEDAYIDTMWSGPEFGIRMLDINWNNNEYLGNPPDPDYPSPVYPNPCSCENMRKAIWYLHNKALWLPTIIGTGFYEDIHTVVPSSYGPYHKPMPDPYPYSLAAAIAELESDVCPADGAPDFPWDDKNGDTVRNPGEVFWDLNGNGVDDGGDETICLIFVIRSDDIHRLSIANKLIIELNAVGLCVDARYGPAANAYTLWFFGKAAHLYTGAWYLYTLFHPRVDPDYLILWHSSYYWHPGVCYNTGFVNDPILDETSEHVAYANDESEALTNCLAFQDRFAEIAAAVPWFSPSSTYALFRTYTGGTAGVPQGDLEDGYRGDYWDGIVNVQGFGCDDFFSFLNMHPRGDEYGDGYMTIRYGQKTGGEIKSFNPIYAILEHEWKILGLIYDTLLKRNPYDLGGIIPWLASDYEVGTYGHPVYGNCTKVSFTLRPDVFWADGTPLTTADVYFTFVELDEILMSRGLPPPWWYMNVQPILSFSILDAYNFEVLLNVKTVFALMWLGGNIILPKQIWKPLAEDGPVDTAYGDPNMVGCGPWRFQEYVAFSHVLLIANKPGTLVQTDHPGSTPIMSTMGFHRCQPFTALNYMQTPEYYKRYKIPVNHETQVSEEAQLGTTLTNEMVNYYMTDGEYIATLIFNDAPDPVGKVWGTFTLDPVPEPCNAHSIDLEINMSAWACGMIRSSGYWHRLTYEPPPYKYKVHKEFWGWVKAGTTVTIILSLDDVKTVVIEWIATARGTFKFVIQFHFWSYHKIGTLCYKHWFSNCTRYWFTIKEDIAGSTFYDDIGEPCIYKSQLLTPDFKVDIKDVALAAKAFGSYPGHERWSTVADLNSDYQIDIRDIAAIAAKFGWVCLS